MLEITRRAHSFGVCSRQIQLGSDPGLHGPGCNTPNAVRQTQEENLLQGDRTCIANSIVANIEKH